MARHTNIFKNLHIYEDEEIKQINMERKATKKLREIESLNKKSKNDLTDSEKEKISEEKYWKDILNPPPKEPYKASFKQQQQWEKLAKRWEKEEERKRQKQEELKRLQEEDKRLAEEQKRLVEENEHKLYPIEYEYKKQLKESNGNTKKAFHKCSLIFHPDKNIGNELVATENQKKLSEIHEKYVFKNSFRKM